MNDMKKPPAVTEGYELGAWRSTREQCVDLLSRYQEPTGSRCREVRDDYLVPEMKGRFPSGDTNCVPARLSAGIPKTWKCLRPGVHQWCTPFFLTRDGVPDMGKDLFTISGEPSVPVYEDKDGSIRLVFQTDAPATAVRGRKGLADARPCTLVVV